MASSFSILRSLILFFALTPAVSFAQGPVWSFAASIADSVSSNYLATDRAGNYYITGLLQNTTVFGSFTLTSPGVKSVYVIKTGPDGTVMWADCPHSYLPGTITPSSTIHRLQLGTDSSGNSFLTGNVDGKNFIIKYSSTGTIEWSRHIVGVGGVGVSSVTKMDSKVTRAGDIYGCGWYTAPSAQFQSTSGPSFLYKPSNARYGAFIYKYKSDGTLAWTRQATSTDRIGYHGIDVHANGDYALTGAFGGTADIGTATLTVPPGPGTPRDFFTIKFDASGNTLWLKRAVGSNDDYGTQIRSDNAGNCYVHAMIYDITIDTTQINVIPGHPYHHVLLKYDQSGNLLWWDFPNPFGGGGNQLEVGNSGNVYVVGTVYAPWTFGTTNLINTGSANVFVCKYSTDGTPLWAQQSMAVGNMFAQSYYLALDAQENCLLAGGASSGVVFGNYATSFSNQGQGLFIARLGNYIPLLKVVQATTNFSNGSAKDISLQCRISGKVYDENISASGLSFTLLDETGGITIRRYNSLGYQPQPGDSLLLLGRIRQHNGLTFFEADSLQLLASGLPLELPQQVAQLNEASESEFVELDQPVYLVNPTQWPGSSSNNLVQVSNGSATFDLYIEPSSTVASMQAPAGSFFVRGIGGQNDPTAPYLSGYYLRPRNSGDISRLTGTAQYATGISYQTYPNPVAKMLRIRGSRSSSKISQIVVFNLLGQPIIRKTEAQASQAEVDVSALAPGAYVLQLSTEHGSFQTRFIKVAE